MCAGPSAPCSSPLQPSTTWIARSSASSSRHSRHSIGMSEFDYGIVVDAFQFAYAIGLLAAGRFVDKVGTRIGYIVIMAVWSLSAMGHALANSVLQFGIARSCLGIGESGNFPAAIKTTAEWFPQSERSLATGIFNSGANVGAILAPLIVPWVTIHYGWHCRLSGHRSLQCVLDYLVVHQVPQAHRTPRSRRRRIGVHQSRDHRKGRPIHTLDQTARLPPDLGLYHRQIPHRSHLVVLPVLAALLLHPEIQPRSLGIWACRSSSSTTAPPSAALAEAGSPLHSVSWACQPPMRGWLP